MRWAYVVSAFALVSVAETCLVLPEAGKAPVSVASETAVIVWDPKTKTEHFIRTATFSGATGSMGFLVPTPSAPRLKSLGDLAWEHGAAMKEIEAIIAPRIVTKKRPVYRLTDAWTFDWPAKFATQSSSQLGLASRMMRGGVDVLSESRVGNYDTAVLRADRSNDLLAWLKRNGFQSDARLKSWLDPYVRKGWAITAFRFASKNPTFTSEPVVLSFKTERPFYPYREPEATNAPASQSLRVFVIAPDRQEGRLEDGQWPTAAEYAGPVPSRVVPWLAGGFDLTEGAFRDRWVTSFMVRRGVRPESELFFASNPNNAPIEPTPVVKIVDDPVWGPKGLAATVVGGPVAMIAFGLVRRKRALGPLA